MINGRLQSSLTLTINSPQRQTYKSARYRPHPPSRHVCNPLACIYSSYSCDSISLEQGMAYRSRPNSHRRAVYKHHNYRSSPSTAASQHFFCGSSACSSSAFAANFDQERVGHSAGGTPMGRLACGDIVTGPVSRLLHALHEPALALPELVYREPIVQPHTRIALQPCAYDVRCSHQGRL